MFYSTSLKKIAYKNDCGRIQDCFSNMAILSIEYDVVVNIIEDWIQYIVFEFKRLNISIKIQFKERI